MNTSTNHVSLNTRYPEQILCLRRENRYCQLFNGPRAGRIKKENMSSVHGRLMGCMLRAIGLGPCYLYCKFSALYTWTFSELYTYIFSAFFICTFSALYTCTFSAIFTRRIVEKPSNVTFSQQCKNKYF